MAMSDYHVVGDPSLARPVHSQYVEKTDIEGTKTATGNPLTLSDSAPVNAVNVSVDVDPIQDLHGYDYPWVGGAGKNLLYANKAESKVNNGITFTVNSDGTIRAQGTATATAGLTIASFRTFPLIDTPLKFTCVPVGGGYSTFRAHIWGYDGDNSHYAVDTGNGVTFAFTDFSLIPNCMIAITSGQTVDVVFKPMISTDTNATYDDYEPYENICPISGRTEENVVRVGKNMLHVTATTTTKWGVTFTVYPDGSIDANGSFNANSAQALVLGEIGEGSYILNGVGEGAGVGKFDLQIFDNATNTVITRTYSGDVSFAIPQGKTYQVRIVTRVGYTYNHVKFYPMVRLASITDSTYEPYADKTYTIQFGQTVYGGSLDVTRGKLIITDGYISSYNGETLPSTWISDRDKYESGTIPTTGAEVVYKLAPPIEIDLIPTQIKMLENTNTLYTDYEGDTIHIEYQPNNAIGEAVRAVEESYDAIIQNLIDRVTALENQ